MTRPRPFAAARPDPARRAAVAGRPFASRSFAASRPDLSRRPAVAGRFFAASRPDLSRRPAVAEHEEHLA
ncbi:hypothetical protein [Dactylosporangium sp. CA-092794]|uniref:hypothetical protein n=1 Tax=Dactylosporangium sp. CA-092794 TaxID=3239929 RepID=UPI003D8D49F2